MFVRSHHDGQHEIKYGVIRLPHCERACGQNKHAAKPLRLHPYTSRNDDDTAPRIALCRSFKFIALIALYDNVGRSVAVSLQSCFVLEWTRHDTNGRLTRTLEHCNYCIAPQASHELLSFAVFFPVRDPQFRPCSVVLLFAFGYVVRYNWNCVQYGRPYARKCV